MFELSGVNYEEVLEQGDSILVRVIASSSYRGFELSGVRVIGGSSYRDYTVLLLYYFHYNCELLFFIIKYKIIKISYRYRIFLMNCRYYNHP